MVQGYWRRSRYTATAIYISSPATVVTYIREFSYKVIQKFRYEQLMNLHNQL